MRAAPIGLICAVRWQGIPYGTPLSRTFELGCRSAAITHGHPSGYIPTGVFASTIFGIARGNTIAGAVADALSILSGWSGHQESLAALDLHSPLPASARTIS